jgi:hypothetical protein
MLFLLLLFSNTSMITTMAALLFYIYERKTRIASKKAKIKLVDVNTQVDSILRNFYSIKLFSKEKEEYKKAKNIINTWYSIDTKVGKLSQ